MKITRVNHAALNIAAGITEVEHFYTRLLGIPTVPRQLPPEFAARVPGFWMQLGQTQVHIIQAPLEGRAREPVGPHIAFYVDDLDAAVAELGVAGIEFDRSRYEEGDHVIFVGEVERCSHAHGESPLLYHGGKFYAEHPL